jgi:hypothetical protein
MLEVYGQRLLVARPTVTLPAGMGLPRLLALGLLAFLLLSAPAAGAITSSSITFPGNGSELFYDGDNGSGSVTVRGTATPVTRSGKGDLLCYAISDSKWTKLASGIDTSTGSFATVASLSPIGGAACRLALVPAGRTPTGGAAAAFAGPAISVSDQYSHASGGNLHGYYVLSGTLTWSFALQSLGECPVANSYATDPATLGSFSLFSGDACLPRVSGVGAAGGARSSLQIDGLNAYAPGAISALIGQPGFEPLSYSTSFSASHDTVTINETDMPTICDPPAAFPPTSASCPSLHDSGIRISQSTQLLPGGQVVRVRQVFTSVDGRAHAIDALFSHSVQAPEDARSPGFEFPGQGSFAAHGRPDSFSAFPPGPSSIVVVSNAAGLLPATSNPIGAITFGRPPQGAMFVSSAGAKTATLLTHYADTVPAGASVAYDWSFSQASSSVALASLEQTERDRFFSPTVRILSPRPGATVTNPVLTVRGTVSDPVRVGGLTVGGRSVAIAAADGSFTARVGLRTGRNVISATATNDAGNASTTSVVVTLNAPACKVPELRGQSLRAAERALTRSYCGLGTITRAHSRRVGQGRVISNFPRSGGTHRHGTRIDLVISRGR